MFEAPHVVGWIHAFILIALCWKTACRLLSGAVPRLCAAFLLTWSNLVFTGLILATFSRLGSLPLYFCTSLILGAGGWALVARRGISPLPGKLESTSEDTTFDSIVRRTLAATVVLAALAALVICWHYVPNNWDSCTYRFGRVFFYLSQGHLLHFAKTLDVRLLNYPLNAVLAYVFFAIYQYSAHWTYFLTGVAWVFAGLGAYFVSRKLGASHTGSLVAAWLGVMAPNVLAQSVSTTDEVLAATPILIGLGFGIVWLTHQRRRFAILTGLGIGLGCGTKLHWTFYWTFVLAGAICLIVMFLRKSESTPTPGALVRGILLASGVALPLTGAFAVCNYISSSQIMDPHLADVALNRPFQVAVASEKLRINTFQLFLNPIPDLAPPIHPERRTAAYAAFNEFFRKCCFSDLKHTNHVSSSGYRFDGLVKPDGYRYHEYTVWLGFLPHLFLLAGVVGVWTRKLPGACMVLLASFFFWHATNSAQSLYIDDVPVYYGFPAVLSVAALGPAWDFARGSRRLPGKLLLAGFLAVFATHLLLGANLLVFGGLRGVRFLWSKDAAPGEMHPVAPATVDAIRWARNIYIPYTHWEILYWNFMRFNPAARYSTGLDLRTASPDTMMLIAAGHESNRDLLPVKLPGSVTSGLRYVGRSENDQMFASSQAGGPRYMLVPIETTGDGVHSNKCCAGVEPKDGVELRYELQSTASQQHAVGEWFTPGQPDSGVKADPAIQYDILAVETRIKSRPDEVVRTVHRRGTKVFVVGGD